MFSLMYLLGFRQRPAEDDKEYAAVGVENTSEHDIAVHQEDTIDHGDPVGTIQVREPRNYTHGPLKMRRA